MDVLAARRDELEASGEGSIHYITLDAVHSFFQVVNALHSVNQPPGKNSEYDNEDPG
jgi:hypothetical protein